MKLKLRIYKYYKTVTYPDGTKEDWYIIPGMVYGPLKYIVNFI